MPLFKGKSKKTFVKNLKTELKAGKPKAQSLAIAYDMQRRSKKAYGGDVQPPKGTEVESSTSRVNPEDMAGKICQCQPATDDSPTCAMCGLQKMAQGGQITDNYESPKSSKVTDPDLGFHEFETGFQDHQDGRPRFNKPAGEEDSRRLGQHGAIELGPEDGMAEGGQITDNYADTEDGDGEEMVGRIMKQRQQRFSRGGRVANEDHGPNDSRLAGFDQNEFDDLSLRDDLEFSETGANSGDELSSAGEDARREDMIKRIMASRKKKDRLPNPA